MFKREADKTRLRQGDILEGFYYPVFKSSEMRLVGNPRPPQSSISPLTLEPRLVEKSRLQAMLDVERCFVIVLSQCCELQVNQQGKPDVPAFVLAPLVDTPYNIRIKPENLEKFRANSTKDYVNLFHISQRTPLTSECAVDFNKVFSVQAGDYQFALKGKVLEMTDEARVLLKVKLGLHFGRPTQEEISARIYPS